MHMIPSIMLLCLLGTLVLVTIAARMPSLPARSPQPGPSSSQVAPPGAGYFDSICREADVTAVDTWTAISGWAGATPGSVKVPSQARYLCGIDIVTAWDLGGAVGVGAISAFRLSGNGIAKGGMHRYLAHGATQTIVTDAGAGMSVNVMHYPLAIPVVGGNDIDAEGILLGSDPGEATFVMAFQFSDKPAPGGFTDGDFREGDIAAVDTETQLTAIGTASPGNPTVPIDKSVLAAVTPLIAIDAGTGAVTVRQAGAARIGGNGLKLGGSYRFVLPGGWMSAVTTGGGAFSNSPVIQAVGLPLVPGNTLELYAIVLGEDPGDTYTAIGLLYQ